MALDFLRPWALALALAGCAAVFWIDRRYGLRVKSLRRRVTLIVRMVLVVALALAIAAPSVLLSGGEAARWILLDVSDSAKDEQTVLRERIRQELETLPADEQAGVIVFGADAMVETPVSHSPSFTGVHTQVNTEGSDLDNALRLALGLLPSESAGGLTVVTDGLLDVSQSTIEQLAAREIAVDALSVSSEDGPDAQVSEVSVPSEIYEGQSIPLRVLVDSSAEMSATLVLYQNGELTATRDVTLQKGENRFAFTDTAQKTGIVTYEVRLIAEGDRQARNNSLSAYAHVMGAPTVALISETDAVSGLLLSSGMKVEVLRPAEMPLSADGYLNYDAVVLNNIDYDTATEAQWNALDAAVRTLGCGLCVWGGDSSYALGGYRGTLVEELLPVKIDVREKLRIPSLALIICIDKSGSMTEGQFGSTRIEVAKEAAMSAVEVLTEKDMIGVIGFDDTAKWVVPFQNVTDVAAIQSQIGTMRADGGTAFYSAMDEAYRTLAASDAPQKHVIFLSDGQPADSGFEDIALAMQKAGITLTTVAVGSSADTFLMNLLSTLGGGRSYTVGEFDNIPKIFTKETMLVGGSYVQNRTFTPVITLSDSLTDFSGFPTLDGYLTTAEKPTATVALMSDTDEPLLAWWNAGAGKVIAWTSDAEGAWTGSFMQWENAPGFFGGMVAKVLSSSTRDGAIEASVDEGTLSLRYTVEEATDESLKTTATVISPDGTKQSLALTETALGQYEADMAADSEGSYVIRVEQEDETGVIRSQEGGAVHGFSSEYDLRVSPGNGLSRLCERTGGRLLTGSDSFWDTPVQTATTRRQLDAALCVLALILILLDIALRKLPWEEAVARWLDRPEKETKAERQPPKPPKETKPGKRAKKEAREQAAQATAGALLSAKHARERK